MRHYCNKQNPKNKPEEKNSVVEKTQQNSITSDVKTENSHEGKTEEEVVFPPDINYEIYGDTGVRMRNFRVDSAKPATDYGEAQGGSVNQGSGYIKQSVYELEQSGNLAECCQCTIKNDNLFYDNLSGRFDLLSIPQNRDTPRVLKSMLTFLKKYKGKYICIDFWNTDNIRIEKCGYLYDISNGCIVIHNPNINEMTMLDLNTIKYINVYCR